MTGDDLTATERATLDELDLIALRLFGPLTYADLDHDQATAVVWESVRELCGSFDPPLTLTEQPPEGWAP